jgi:hypothetical protein
VNGYITNIVGSITGNTDFTQFTSGSLITVNTPCIVRVSVNFNTNTAVTYLNGKQILTNSTVYSYNDIPNGNQIFIGENDHNNNGYLNGSVWEVIMINQITDNIQDYLQLKYNIYK